MQILRETKMAGLKRAMELGPDGVIKLLKEKGLTCRGGAMFTTGQKWEMVKNAPGDERFVICNADEGEPGTFKDRLIIEKNPATLIEGIMIAANTVGAKKAYIYLRGEYTCLKEGLQENIDKLTAKSDMDIEIFMGSGAYICGEETAIIKSIEGYRGQAQLKPPFPTTKGLFGKPTLINNVETLANVPLALCFDDWDNRLRLFSLSGNVQHPGVYELPMGTLLSKLVGLGSPANKVKAVYFGCFGGCLPYEKFKDMPLSPEAVCQGECMIGSCTLIVVDENHSIVDVAANIAKFYEFESCGKCTPCREGTMRVLAILENISEGDAKKADLATLKELSEVIRDTSFCGLGKTATIHLLNALKYFRDEFEEKLKE
jgi:NADH:ubiquinone oxidoreductase subunit F (NADH-binding)